MMIYVTHILSHSAKRLTAYLGCDYNAAIKEAAEWQGFAKVWVEKWRVVNGEGRLISTKHFD